MLTGADFAASLDGQLITPNGVITVHAGALLELGNVQGPGARAYILFDGGVDVAQYLGSASTFTLGKFGGHAGRALRSGDVLHLREASPSQFPVRPLDTPSLTHDWRIGVIHGPSRRPRFLHQTGHPDVVSNILEGSLQFQPDGRAPDRSQTGMGPS